MNILRNTVLVLVLMGLILIMPFLFSMKIIAIVGLLIGCILVAIAVLIYTQLL